MAHGLYIKLSIKISFNKEVGVSKCFILFYLKPNKFSNK